MKIRHPLIVKMVGFAVACVVRVWIGLVRYRYRALGANCEPIRRGCRGRYLYAFWHEDLLLPAYHYSCTGAHVLVSEHADGELIARACRHLGLRLVRGSTTRHGVKALLGMLRHAGKTHLVVTPDGPRGPRRQVQPGLIFLAARTGLPIIAIGFAYSRAWRTGSWDRMALPWPWSSAVCVQAEPIVVPANARGDQLEAYRLRVEDAFRRAEVAAARVLHGATRAGDAARARRAA